MKLSMKEKKVLYAFACPNHHNTETEMEESWYTGFYHQLRAEMDEYYRAKRRLRLVKENTEYEEDLYDEAV